MGDRVLASVRQSAAMTYAHMKLPPINCLESPCLYPRLDHEQGSRDYPEQAQGTRSADDASSTCLAFAFVHEPKSRKSRCQNRKTAKQKVRLVTHLP